MPSSRANATIALHLAGTGDRRVVTVPLRRVELDGTLVLALRHPVDLKIGRMLTISLPSAEGWGIQRVRVEKPRFLPHEDAGLLRLLVVAGGVALENDPDDVVTAPAEEDAAAAPAGAPQGAGVQRGELRVWQGRHPIGNVALRLNSGRVRTMPTRRIDEEGALVLAARRPTVLRDGESVQIAYSERRGWLTAATIVVESRPDGHPDAGLLRLRLQGDPQEQKERRSGARVPVRLALRGTVERGAASIRGTRFEASTLDVSIGGLAFVSDLDLARGDRMVVRLIGSDGQLPGGDVTIEVLRIEALPGQTERKIVAVWRDAPNDLQRALRKLVES
jgi:hypothetical protein